MRKRNETSNESLELLLDTICNTFGGILFISLLIVILLNTTSKEVVSSTPSKATMADLIEEETRRAELTAKLTELSNKVDQQKKISDVVYSKDLKEVAKEFTIQESKGQQLQVETSTTLGEAAQSQVAINGLAQQQQQRQAKLNAARAEAKSLQIKVDETVKNRSQVATIPKVTEGNTDPDIFFLTEGRIFGPYTAGSNDFKEVTTARGLQLVHNPTAGLPIDFRGSNTQALASKMVRRTTISEGVRVYVWPDSYEHWETVRYMLDEKGIKKHLVPCEADTALYLGSGSQAASTFQ